MRNFLVRVHIDSDEGGAVAGVGEEGGMRRVF
jgi:hypothetical protein